MAEPLTNQGMTALHELGISPPIQWLFALVVAVILGLVFGLPGVFVGLVAGAAVGMIVARRSRKTAVRSPAPVSESALEVNVPLQTAPPRRAAAVRRKPELTWYPPGLPVALDDLRIEGGMFYASSGPLPWPGEPSAVDVTHRVARRAADPMLDLGYFPSFDRITGEQARAYLEWLAAGRRDADPAGRALGYMFLFFYGLERRLLLDRDDDPALLEEILGLLAHYAPAHKSRSLRSYAAQLLHFAGWRQGAEAYRALWPRVLEWDGDRPNEEGLRFILANLHKRGEPLDWTVAYRLAMADEESRRSTVTTKAREKFWALFEQRYRERFPAGIALEAAKQPAVAQYRPASSVLLHLTAERKHANAFELRLPNVIGLRRQFKALPEIWNGCVEDLSGYSRALGSKRKQGSAAALAAWQALPPELRRAEEHPLAPAWQELLAEAPREGDYAFAAVSSLASLAGIAERAKLTAAQSRQVAAMAESLGWRVAPHPACSGVPFAWTQEVALYRADRAEGSAEHLAGLVRLLYLAVTLAAADSAVEDGELVAFHQLIAAELPEGARWQPLLATEAALRRDANVALRALPQIAKLVPSASRAVVLRTLAHIAAADGAVSLDEIKVLRRIARAFELEDGAVETLLREDAMFREVTVAGAEPPGRAGEAIPPRPGDAPAAFALDHRRIQALTAETREVISLLSAVMQEEEAEPAPALAAAGDAPAIADSAAPAWLEGLAPRYRPALTHLLQRDEITLADFDALATQHHLLPDDLLTAINGWADEALGDFLLERGENVRIYRDLAPDAAAPLAA